MVHRAKLIQISMELGSYSYAVQKFDMTFIITLEYKIKVNNLKYCITLKRCILKFTCRLV